MTGQQKGFVGLMLLVLVTAMLVGGGVFLYVSKKKQVAITPSGMVVQTDQRQPAKTESKTTAQTSSPKWVGTTYCENAWPPGTSEVASYGSIDLGTVEFVMTPDGEEAWSLNILDQRDAFLNHTKNCPQLYTVKSSLKFPPTESGLTLGVNCKMASSTNPNVVGLVDEKAYTSTDTHNPVHPAQAWKVNRTNGAFDVVSTSQVLCYPEESDPY